ncbi:MAG: hypothetical protein Q4D36_07920 [Bacteroidales bacterium]|nr:hypothetical protein [Bacteroidales bacterium]
MKKVKLIMSVIGAWLVCHTAQAQYFCTNQGAELSYVTYDEAGQSVTNETVTVTNVRKQDGKTWAMYFTKIVNNKATNNTSYTLYNWNYDGGKSVCEEDLMYGPYIASDSDPVKYNETVRQALLEDKKFKGDNSFTLKDNAKAGESIPDYSYSYLNGVLKNEITISGAAYMGEEQVGTTAGQFDCLKISYLKRTKVVLKTTTVRVTEWYARGIGLVKSESYDMKGKSAGKVLLVKMTEK